MYWRTIFSSKTSFFAEVIGRVIVNTDNSPPISGNPTTRTVAIVVSKPSLFTSNLVM